MMKETVHNIENAPLVSVVVATHNRLQLLKRAIDSVRRQTYVPIEIIIVDDKSTDGTSAYVDGLHKEDPHIKCIKIAEGEAGGGQRARNMGIDAASGEWVAFLDDDDVWLKSKIEHQIEYLQNHKDVKALSCDAFDIIVIGKRSYSCVRKVRPKKEPLGFFVQNWINVTSTLVVSRQVLVEIGKFDEDLPAMQELELSYRICLKYNVANLEIPLVEYYNYFNSIQQVTSGIDRFLKACELVEKKFAAELNNLTLEQKCRREMYLRQDLAGRYYRNGNKKMFRKTLRPTLRQSGPLYLCAYYMSYLLNYKQYIIIKKTLKNLLEKIRGTQ